MSSNILDWPLAKMYPYLVEKAKNKGKTKAEVDQIYCWLTGHTPESFQAALNSEITYGEFFAKAPKPNPNRKHITGFICGVRVENIEDPVMQDLRYIDKLVDELVKGKSMNEILLR